HPRSLPFPYTTLFRSAGLRPSHGRHHAADAAAGDDTAYHHEHVGAGLRRDNHDDHDEVRLSAAQVVARRRWLVRVRTGGGACLRSEEHTSELQSLAYL